MTTDQDRRQSTPIEQDNDDRSPARQKDRARDEPKQKQPKPRVADEIDGASATDDTYD